MAVDSIARGMAGKALQNGGTTDYHALTNQPQINGVTLIGNQTTSQLDIYAQTPLEEETVGTLELMPNIYYKWGEVTDLTITLAPPLDNTIINEYMFEFVSGATPTTLTLPSTVVWIETPTIEPNKTYQASILNNIGILLGV